MEELKRLVAHFGTQYKLAEALGVTESAVSQWISTGGLPARRAIKVEQLTKGEFKAIDIVVPSEVEEV